MVRQLSTVVVAAAVGALVALVWSGRDNSVEASSPSRVETKELLLLDEQNRPAARLASSQARTVLQFLGSDAAPALEFGVDNPRGVRFIHFLGKDGTVIAALNCLPPNGESTLYLGDERWESRVILGALQTDMPTTAGINDWGLQFRKPGSREALFSVLVKPGPNVGQFQAGVRAVRANGKVWEVQ